MNPETATETATAPAESQQAAPSAPAREGLWREAPPYFDDLRIGDAMESSGRTVTEYDVVSFASLTGDWHPQHADAAWAAESPFGRRIAHGMLVISYALGLLPIDPRVVLALRSLNGAVLKRPVGLGDTIRVRAKVAEKRPLGEETGLVTLAVRILNQEGELVARMEIVVLWRRAPEPADHRSAGTSGDAASGSSTEDELSPIQDGRLLA
jgi:3-hydroxybutyryl-CoA dehydratase